MFAHQIEALINNVDERLKALENKLDEFFGSIKDEPKSVDPNDNQGVN